MNNWLGKRGRGVFYLFLILHLLPFFSVDILLTLDGPSHLYNAKLFNEILSGNNTISELYQINSELVPNYTGHLILSFLIWVTTPILALKIIHILYVVGLAFAFRKLVLELSPKNGNMSVLIFPLIYSAPFISGFYNFSLALILLLFTLFFWMKNNNKHSILFYVKLSVLFLLTYLSHSFTFGILCLSIAIIIIVKRGLYNYKNWLVDGLKVVSAAIIPLVLGIVFVLSRESNYSYLSNEDLWNKIYNYEFIYAFHNDSSFWVLTYIFFSLFGSVIFKEKRHLAFIYITFVLLVMYFFMPDGVGYASVFSVRTLMLCFLFFTIWLSLQNRNKIFQYIVITLLFFYQNNRIIELMDWSVDKNNKSKEMLAVSELISENSIILPIRTIDVWQYFHISNFLGVKKPQIILENYEAAHDYFPIKWKSNLEEAVKVQSNSLFGTTINGKEYKVEYLVVIGTGKTDNDKELQQIEFAKNNYPKVYQSYFVTLYKITNKL